MFPLAFYSFLPFILYLTYIADMCSVDSPLLWIRVDPEMEYLAEIHFHQPVQMWVGVTNLPYKPNFFIDWQQSCVIICMKLILIAEDGVGHME